MNRLLQTQVRRAHKEQGTPKYLQAWTLWVAQEVLLRVYPRNELYLQSGPSSQLLRAVLKRLGIAATMHEGQVAVQHWTPQGLAWSGFWEEGHTFLVTEFGETVDLVIRWLPEHPEVSFPTGMGFHPVWWPSTSKKPTFLTYQSDSILSKSELPEALQTALDDVFELYQEAGPEKVHTGVILNGKESLEQLALKRDPWVLNLFSPEKGSFSDKECLNVSE
jgi:hypothetical protein